MIFFHALRNSYGSKEDAKRKAVRFADSGINLPDGSGLELCREIRRGSKVPIMLLTARDMELDIVKGPGVRRG